MVEQRLLQVMDEVSEDQWPLTPLTIHYLARTGTQLEETRALKVLVLTS